MERFETVPEMHLYIAAKAVAESKEFDCYCDRLKTDSVCAKCLCKTSVLIADTIIGKRSNERGP